MRRAIALLVFLGMTAPALACLNDEELPSREREFRSQYGMASRGEERPTRLSPRVLDPMLLGGGSALLVMAMYVASSRTRTRK